MNKKIIIATLSLIIISITSVTIYKVISIHNENLIKVEEKYIIETAKKCLNEKKCSGNKITLQTLYDQKYLNKASNPVTKEYYNPESYILVEDNEYIFIVL